MTSESSSSFLSEFPELTYFGKTLNGTEVIVYNNSLFYKFQGQNIIKYCDKVKKVEVYQNLIVVLFDQGEWNKSLDLIVLKENFSDLKKVFVKDKAFNIDDINKYLMYSKRDIKDFYISDGELFVLFKDEFNDISSSSISLSSFSSDSSHSSFSSFSSDSSSSSESSSSSNSSSSSESSSSSNSSSSSDSSSSSESSSSSFSEVIPLLVDINNNVITDGIHYIQL